MSAANYKAIVSIRQAVDQAAGTFAILCASVRADVAVQDAKESSINQVVMCALGEVLEKAFRASTVLKAINADFDRLSTVLMYTRNLCGCIEGAMWNVNVGDCEPINTTGLMGCCDLVTELFSQAAEVLSGPVAAEEGARS